ncbi:MAG: pyruvate dehydrogenase complex dihydrolipoamide acetyltransferase [Alphaproteobacteria bacterium]|nr:pyruvate dehydrogenase complex dihydrolipoamide acetyltransferase [Alphaproteobacteria bacterium]
MPTDILMPALSPTMEEGTLTKWLVKEGDEVRAGDVIAEIETDKATMEVEAVDEGTLGKILVAAGTENVKVNEPIAVLLGDGESKSDVKENGAATKAEPPKSAPPTPAAKEPAAERSDEPAAPKAPASATGSGGRLRVSPLARRLAKEKGIDLTALTGSGPGGRIVKADIEGAPKAAAAPAKAAPSSPAKMPAAPAPSLQLDARAFFPEGAYEEIPHDNIRRTIARRLTAAKRDIPHYYLTVDCTLDALLELRRELNAKSPKDGEGAFKLSVNDFIIRASALALMKVPGVNASWTETAILRHAHADIGMAVAMPFGLITPIITKAETKGLAQIAKEAKDLAARARDRKLKPQEFEGGTFAVSNLGMYGIKDFTAVINPPHSAILAVGAGEMRPVVKDGALAMATIMTVQLSCDHRVIDGALGAQWLAAFKGFTEDPVTMML